MYQFYKNKNKSLKNFKDKLNTNGSFHDHNTRIKDLLRKPKGRLKLFDNTVIERGIEVWNYLHYSIKMWYHEVSRYGWPVFGKQLLSIQNSYSNVLVLFWKFKLH